MSDNRTLQLKRASGFTSTDSAMMAINAMLTANEMKDGEPFIAEATNGEVVLGIKSSESGSIFYNASTIEGLILAVRNSIGNLDNITTTQKSSIVAAINEIVSDINALDASDIAYESGATDTIVNNAKNVDEAIKSLDVAVANTPGVGTDYASGVTINSQAHVVHGVVDPTSEEFLRVGSDGFKVSGVTDAINTAIESLYRYDCGTWI